MRTYFIAVKRLGSPALHFEAKGRPGVLLSSLWGFYPWATTIEIVREVKRG